MLKIIPQRIGIKILNFPFTYLYTFTILTLSLLSLVISEDKYWNYKQHGTDWPSLGYSMCKGIESPAPLSLKTSQAVKLQNTQFFFSKMNSNKTGILEKQDFNNNLVLNFNESIGKIYYKLERDDFDPDTFMYYFFECSSIYFRMPGEHIFDKLRYDMELQFNCTGYPPGFSLLKTVFVAVPVDIVKSYKNQARIFDNFEAALNGSNSTLPVEIKVDGFDEILNAFDMFYKMFFYKGTSNFPPCKIDSDWIVIEKVLEIKESLYDKLFGLLSEDSIYDGNYREASEEKVDDYYILEHSFGF